MRRFLVCGSLLCVLASCAKPSGLPPEQVLQNAARASQELQSARYTLTSAFVSKTDDRVTDMDLTMEGVLQDGGSQTQLNVRFDGSLTEGEQRYDAKGEVDVIVAWENDVYVFLRSLSVRPEYPLFNKKAMERFMGTWWRIPTGEDQRVSSSMTPDPRLLRAQSEIVRVVKDRGIASINGREAYHYDVAMDLEKLAAFLKRVADERGETFDAAATKEFLSSLHASGELWIDTETFYLHRIVWNIPSSEAGGLSGQLRADLRDHDAAPPVTPPAQYKTFSPLLLLDDASFLQDFQNVAPIQEKFDPRDVLPTDEWQDEGSWFEQDPSIDETAPDYPFMNDD